MIYMTGASKEDFERGIKTIIAGIIIGLVILGISALADYPTVGLGLMGLIVLFSTLVGVNIFSEGYDLSKGEVRKAIAISFISVFFGLLIVGNNIDKLGLEKCVLKDVLDKFWVIIVTIIGFYFAGRVVEEQKDKKESSDEPKTPKVE